MSVSILINYKTKQPSNLAWNIFLTSWLCDIGARFSIRLSVRPPVCSSVNSSLMSKFDIYVKVSILINYNSTTTIIPCMTHLPDLLTWQVHWPSDLDLYFALHFDTVYVDVPDLLNYKVYNYQTLHSASPRCTDSASTLTRWPWPIFCAPVNLTHFVSTFDISSTIRPTTIKPCKARLGGKFHPRYLPVAFAGIYRSGKYSSSGKYWQIPANWNFFGLKKLQKSLNKLHWNSISKLDE